MTGLTDIARSDFRVMKVVQYFYVHAYYCLLYNISTCIVGLGIGCHSILHVRMHKLGACVASIHIRCF